VTILEGEGLVNDATALVLLRSAVAAMATAVTFWSVIADFAYAVVVALAIGALIGFVTVRLRRKLADPVLDTAISFAVPFIAFIPAEYVGASGVLAVVVAGLYSGHSSARHFSAQARISERLNWRTAQFVLENGVFLLMGLEISALIVDVEKADLSARYAIAIGLLMVVTVMAVRFVFVVPLMIYLRTHAAHTERKQTRFRAVLDRLRGRQDVPERFARRQERAEQVYSRRQSDLELLRAEGLGWRGGLVLSWSGMRGVVTLAAAQSLPEDLEYRSQLVLIAFTVAVATLLIQGGTLPWLIRVTGIRGSDRVADNRALAELLDEMGEAGLAVLAMPQLDLPEGEEISPVALERVRNDTLLTAEAAWERADQGVGRAALAQSPQRQYRQLRREVLQAERLALLDARSSGSYPSRILSRAQAMLDLEETRLQQIDSPG
jgi:NhaP-type Na+/H+ or K+/H+ antiporter